MSRDKRVKDKRIILKRGLYRAIVEYYRDKPSRDGDTDTLKSFESISAAQGWLEQFPQDMWDGPGLSDRHYAEIDERKKNAKRRKTRKNSSTCENGNQRQDGRVSFGRTIIGPVRGVVRA